MTTSGISIGTVSIQHFIITDLLASLTYEVGVLFSLYHVFNIIIASKLHKRF